MLHFNSKWGILPFLCLLLATLACSAVQPGQAVPPSPQPGAILFQDDFSDPASGWNRVSAPNGMTDYADGMYRIWVNEANLDVWARPGLNLDDVRIDVDTIKVAGERDNRFGIICRLDSADNFYVFLITSDGYFGIAKSTTGQIQLLNAKRLQPSQAIQTGSALNHIRADCVGSTLALYINNQKIVEVQDTQFEAGDVGLLVGSFETPGIDIRFDNFVVREP